MEREIISDLKKEFPGIDIHHLRSASPDGVRIVLHELADTFYHQVDDDWHDGYEYQAETLGEYKETLCRPASAVVYLCDKGVAFDRCCSVLSTFHNSWRHILATEMRGGTEEMMREREEEIMVFIKGDGEHKFDTPVECFDYLWRYFSEVQLERQMLQIHN
eukprot:UN23887